ncbi:hypothetical protein [Rosenbergiella australiborealis]|nr:hypothetical protein [Rosenbergiella australiborealis]
MAGKSIKQRSSNHQAIGTAVLRNSRKTNLSPKQGFAIVTGITVSLITTN